MHFEKLLEEHISIFEKTIGNDFENKLHGENFYYISDEYIKKDFFNMKYNILTISSDENSMVKSISILFHKVIDRLFYDLFVGQYGEPTYIYGTSNIKVVSESHLKDENDKILQTARKSTFDLIECGFDEKPIFILWKKDYYYIKAFLRHEQYISEISFSIDSPPFYIEK